MVKAWIKKKKMLLITIGCLALIGIYIVATAGTSGVAGGDYSLEKSEAFLNAMTFDTGAPAVEQTSHGGYAWYKMASRGRLVLWLEPEAGSIAVENTATGRWWSSRPGEEELKAAGGKGIWATNVQSAVMFEYLKADERGANLTASNTLEQAALASWRIIDGGVGVKYELPELGFIFYVEVTLTAEGFKVHLPAEGIVEQTGNRLATYQLYPFMGATMSSDGFLLLPDGPGSLIRFDRPVNAKWSPYDYPIYGSDEAAHPPGDYFPRSNIAFPVYGINSDEEGILVIIEDGEFHADIIASPAGLQTAFNRANAQFNVRRPYDQPKGLTSYLVTYERGRFQFPVTMNYRMLEQGKSGYVDMAKSYRTYLMAEKGMRKLGEGDHSGEPRLFLNILIAAMEKGRLGTGTKTVVSTTFSQAQEMVGDLYAAGVTNIELGFIGWNQGGLPGNMPKLLPIEEQAGGEQGLAEVAAFARQLDIPVRLDHDFAHAREALGNGFSTGDAARKISGELLKHDQKITGLSLFRINPEIMAHSYMPTIIEQMSKLPISHLAPLELGRLTYSDFSQKHYVSRARAAEAYVALLDRLKQTFGTVYTSGASAYVLGHADHLFGFPAEYNYDMPVSEQVPFYAIALHGLVTYSTDGGNQRAQPREGFLRDIEYGALPFYTITHEDPHILRYTQANTLFSSQYAINRGQMIEEYAGYAEANRGVRGKFIENHRKLAEGVFETVYEGGKTIWVNYNQTIYTNGSHTVEPMSYRVVSEGGQP